MPPPASLSVGPPDSWQREKQDRKGLESAPLEGIYLDILGLEDRGSRLGCLGPTDVSADIFLVQLSLQGGGVPNGVSFVPCS